MTTRTFTQEELNALTPMDAAAHADVRRRVRNGETVKLVCLTKFRQFTPGRVYAILRIDMDEDIVLLDAERERHFIPEQGVRMTYFAVYSDTQPSASPTAKARAKETYKSVPLDMLVARYEELTGEAEGIKELFQERTRSIT